MGSVYADPDPEIRDSLRTEILETATETEQQKPWNLVESVADETEFSEDDARAALKEMMLDGELEIASSGEVRATSSPA